MECRESVSGAYGSLSRRRGTFTGGEVCLVCKKILIVFFNF